MASTDKTIAFLVGPEGIEQAERVEPWKAVQDAGGSPKLVSKEPGTVQAFHHLTPADTFPVDATLDSASADQFDALVLPGGVAMRAPPGSTRRSSSMRGRSHWSPPASRTTWRRSAGSWSTRSSDHRVHGSWQ